MTATKGMELPSYETLLLTRKERLLTITFNRPDALNAVDAVLHEDFLDAITFAANDENSDVVVLTGSGRAFSAGGDLRHMSNVAKNPELFYLEAQHAKQIVYAMLDLEKPLICKLNGHAVGLGATIALICDVVFAADGAKIGDPHVNVGLVAGDGGAVIWPHLIGFARAKEYLMTGELIPAKKAEEIGLVNHCVPAAELDAAVDDFCQRLLNGATNAIRWTKVVVNLELKRIAHAIMDPGIAYETVTVHSVDHREAVAALLEKRKPDFQSARKAAKKDSGSN